MYGECGERLGRVVKRAERAAEIVESMSVIWPSGDHFAELSDGLFMTAELRQRLAAEAYGLVAAYHAEIAAYLSNVTGELFPGRLALVLEKVDDLRYGENPPQRAAFYREMTHRAEREALLDAVISHVPFELWVFDAQGRCVPAAQNKINFALAGAGNSSFRRLAHSDRVVAVHLNARHVIRSSALGYGLVLGMVSERSGHAELVVFAHKNDGKVQRRGHV